MKSGNELRTETSLTIKIVNILLQSSYLQNNTGPIQFLVDLDITLMQVEFKPLFDSPWVLSIIVRNPQV